MRTRHAPQAFDAVGHALVEDGLDWEEAEPFVLFHQHATRLLEREAAARAHKAGATTPSRVRGSRVRASDGRRVARGSGDFGKGVDWVLGAVMFPIGLPAMVLGFREPPGLLRRRDERVGEFGGYKTP